jgi:hypothetical protein
MGVAERVCDLSGLNSLCFGQLLTVGTPKEPSIRQLPHTNTEIKRTEREGAADV